MIIRKPYAFLIKYFQKINILLLLLVIFIYYKDFRLYQFAKEYLATASYNVSINPISNYVNIYTTLSFMLIIIITAVLSYLLKRKDKPYFSYILMLLVNILVFILFMYVNNYFTYQVFEGYKLVTARAIRDLMFISTLFYYPMMLILLIRAIGIDLKNFGFQEDKEFLEIKEEDREEVEVQVGFDKDKFIRKIKYRVRNLKYFILEHKFYFMIIILLLVGILGYNFYNYFYVENKIYKMSDTFNSNYYQLKINNVYLTDKDYAGNIVSEKGTYFVLVDLNIKNLVNTSRTFDTQNVFLFVDDEYYIPTTKFNSYFSDMGNLYTGKSINALDETSYLLVYELPEANSNANFVLKYQDINKDGKFVRVKIKVLDISTFKDKGSSKLNEEFNVPINLSESVNFKINSYDLLDSVNYTYQSCNTNTCPIYQGTITTSENEKVMYMRAKFNNITKSKYLEFLSKYGKIRYKVGDEYKLVRIKPAVNKIYRGDYLYLIVPSEVANSDEVDLVFTVRTYQYYYKLKGE